MYLSEHYPHLVELLPIGKTAEGRQLKVVKISSGQTRENVVKPAIWIDGGTMHYSNTITAIVNVPREPMSKKKINFEQRNIIMILRMGRGVFLFIKIRSVLLDADYDLHDAKTVIYLC